MHKQEGTNTLYVDDVIIVGKEPDKYLEIIKSKYPIQNVSYDPKYYLASNLEVRKDGTTKVSGKKYISEMLRNYEKEN